MKYTNRQKRQLVKQDYNAIAEIYVKNCSEIEFYKPFIEDFIKNVEGDKILDLGCGHGIFSNYFYQSGFEVTGVDFSKKLLNIAKKNYPKIHFIEEDICDFKSKEKFNGIFLKNVLFHLPDEDIIHIFKNFLKYLEDDGKICILLEIPREEGEQILTEEFDENLKVYYNYLTSDKVESLLKNAGFKIDDNEIVKENKNATIYAFGLMVITASKNL